MHSTKKQKFVYYAERAEVLGKASYAQSRNTGVPAYNSYGVCATGTDYCSWETLFGNTGLVRFYSSYLASPCPNAKRLEVMFPVCAP